MRRHPPPDPYICPACGNPWALHGFSTAGLLWSRTREGDIGLLGCHVVDLLLGGFNGWASTRLTRYDAYVSRHAPKVTVKVTRRRQPKYLRVVEAKCEDCGEGIGTPEGWTGRTLKEIRTEAVIWANQHRQEHMPGGRKGPPAQDRPPV